MWIDVRDGRLYVEVVGSGEPIMLLHGWPLDHRMFEPQVDALSEHFTVITFDRRGFGKSLAQPDLQLEPEDIDQILDTIGLASVHLLGASQGARIALRFAVTRTQRVRSLLLQGPIVDGLDTDNCNEDHVPVAEYAELAKRGNLQEVIDRWLQHPMMWLGEHHEHQYWLLRRILEDYSGLDLIEYDKDSFAFGHDVLSALALFSHPTMLLTGATETVSRRNQARALVERMPNCRELVFEKSGHLSNLTEPELYNQVVVEFCSGIETGIPVSGSRALN